MGVSIYRYIAIDDNPSKDLERNLSVSPIRALLSQKAPEENPKEMKDEISMKKRRYVIPKGERAAALLLVGDTGERVPVNATFNQFIGSG